MIDRSCSKQIMALFAFLTGISGFAADNRLLRALALMARDHRPEAYTILEEAFESATEEAGNKIRAAAILSFATNSELKKHKRHFYAEQALIQADQSGVTLEQRASLLRIAGDGYFDEGKLAEAKHFYEKLSHDADPLNVDFAEYKLGWIDLNSGVPLQAFHRWHKRVEDGRGRQQELRDLLVRDLGRSWAETSPPAAEQSNAVRSLHLKDGESEKFTDGIIAGLRRFKDAGAANQFRASIFETPYATAVLSKMLSQSVVVSHDPCSLLDWLEGPVAMDELKTHDVASTLNRCFVELKKKQPNDWRSSPTRNRLSVAVTRIKATGLDRRMRAEFLREIEDQKLACLEFATMGREHFAASKAQLSEDAVQGFVETCKAYAVSARSSQAQKDGAASSKDEVGRQISMTFLGLLEDYAQARFLGMKSSDPYYALAVEFLDIGDFATVLRKSALDHPEIYHGTLLPVIAASNLSKEDNVRFGGLLLERYGPYPLKIEESSNAVWVEILRTQLKIKLEAHDYEGARRILSIFVPLETGAFKHKLTAELWFMWILALPESPKDPAYNPVLLASGKSATKAFFETWNGGDDNAESAAEKQSLAIAAAMKFGETEAVWTKLRTMALSPKLDPALAAQFYQGVFGLLAEGKIDLKAVGDAPVGKCLNLSALAARNASLAGINEKSMRACEVAFDRVKPPFVSDLKRILALTHDGKAHGKLSFNSQLTHRIEGRFKKLNSQIEELKGQSWSHASLSRLARVAVGGNCDQFIVELEGIPSPRGLPQEQLNVLKTTIHSVMDVVKSWRDVVMKDTGPEKKS